MKRFWKDTDFADTGGGYHILLDGRPLRTPKRQPLVLPTSALADAVREEWHAVGEEIDPARLLLTGIANAAQDHVMPAHDDFAESLSRYAESDLLCYRADHPEVLAARQELEWGGPLKAIEQRHDVHFTVSNGVRFLPQPEDTLARMRRAFASRSPWELAALQPIVTITGSAIMALALIDGLADADQVFAAGYLDELWQEAQWGVDEEAHRSREGRRKLFDAAVRFLDLLR